MEHQVRERAYAIWVETGRGDGQAHAHWAAAEREVRAAADAASARKPATRKAAAPARTAGKTTAKAAAKPAARTRAAGRLKYPAQPAA